MTKSHWSPQVLVGSQGLARGSPLLQCSARQVGSSTWFKAAEDLQANQGCTWCLQYCAFMCGWIRILSTVRDRGFHAVTGHCVPCVGGKGLLLLYVTESPDTHSGRCVLTYTLSQSDEVGCSWPRGPSLPTHTCAIQGLGFEQLSPSS